MRSPGVELATESHGTYLDRIERTLASNGDLLPGGIPASWLGANFEVHGVPTSARSTIGYAVRWHGDRPAVLWEQEGTPVTLTASALDPHWSTTEATGEALWQPQSEPGAASRSEPPAEPDTESGATPPAPTVRPEPGDESVSFG